MYDDSDVTTTNGPVRGRIVDGVHTFRGIRYGRDTGPRRFLPPERPEPWTDPANAFAFGPSAPQDHPETGTDRAQNPFLVKIGLTDNLPESEDCLFLNVWTPAPDTAARPVLVWVHSGAFVSNSGSSPSIDGAHLARTGDVVTITFNHRLGVLGYSHLTDDPASPYAGAGNAGMLDIVAVLEWVRDNAAAFGGDPGNVTLFGQSGGAMKVSALLGMPAARGLFHKAVLQSGANAHGVPAAAAAATTGALCAELGLAAGDVESLRAVPLRELMVAYHAVAARGAWYGAVVDGVVLPAEPFAGSISAHVPVIVGDLDTEATLFLAAGGRPPVDVTAAEVDERVARAVPGDRGASLVAAVREAHPAATEYEVLARVVSDGLFAAETAVVAEARASGARGGGADGAGGGGADSAGGGGADGADGPSGDADAAPTWRYRITWRTPVDGGALLSPHELDVALVFGNIDAAAGLSGGGEGAHRLADLLQASWLAFARTGSPVNDLLPDWPAYTLPDRRMLVLDPEPSVARDVDGPELRLTASLLPDRPNWFAAL